MANAKSSLLWQLSHPDVGWNSYLFGTMHVRDARAFRNLESVYPLINTTQAFALEYDLREMQRYQRQYGQVFLLPEGQHLKNLLPDKKYQKLRRLLLQSVQLDLDRFGHLVPFLITSLVQERMLQQDAPIALDHHLWEYAKGQDKELLGIETYESQVQVVASLPIQEQLTALLKMGQHLRSYRRHLHRAAELYAQGDVQQLYKQTARSTGSLRHVLLRKRNLHMAARIDELARERALFSAIGAGHLGGKNGVLRLLKLKGWKVENIS